MMHVIRKNKLELLVLVSTGIGFAVSFEVGVLFGISSDTDSYLTSVMLINFLSLLSQLSWETINIKYIGKNREEKNRLFSTHLVFTIFIALLLCVFYFIFDIFFLNLLGLERVIPAKGYIIVFLFLFCLLTYLKRILFCEEDLFTFYLIELVCQALIFTFIIVFFILGRDIVLANIFSLLLCNAFAILFLYFKYKVRLCVIDFSILFDGLKGSSKLKVGAFFYSIKDVLIPALFVRYGDGAYTVYNYLSKILTSLLSIIVLPKVNFFAIESLKILHCKPRKVFKDAVYNSVKCSVLYSMFSVIIIVPFLFLIWKVSDKDLIFLLWIFLCVFTYNLIICGEQFFARVVYNFECFNFIFFINVIFGSLIYYIIKLSEVSVFTSLMMIVLLQSLNFVSYFLKARVASEKNQLCY